MKIALSFGLSIGYGKLSSQHIKASMASLLGPIDLIRDSLLFYDPFMSVFVLQFAWLLLTDRMDDRLIYNLMHFTLTMLFLLTFRLSSLHSVSLVEMDSNRQCRW